MEQEEAAILQELNKLKPKGLIKFKVAELTWSPDLGLFKTPNSSFKEKEGFVLQETRFLLPEEAFYIESQGKCKFVHDTPKPQAPGETPTAAQDFVPTIIPTPSLLSLIYGSFTQPSTDPYRQPHVLTGYGFLRKNVSNITRSNISALKVETICLLHTDDSKAAKKLKQTESDKDTDRLNLIQTLIFEHDLPLFDIFESKKDSDAKKPSYTAIIVKMKQNIAQLHKAKSISELSRLSKLKLAIVDYSNVYLYDFEAFLSF